MKITRVSSIDNMLNAFNSRIAQLSDDEEVLSSTNVLAAIDSGSTLIDDDLEDVVGQDSEFIRTDDGSEVVFDINSIDDNKLMEVIDKYNATSQPVSGDWDTETADEQQTIADAFGISLDDAKQVMIEKLGFEPSDSFIEASTSVNCHEYLDETGDAFGEPGLTYTEDELRQYFEDNRYSDPVLEGYASFEDWLSATLDNTNLRFAYVDGGCHVESCDAVGTEINASWQDEYVDPAECEWEQIDHKTVYDSSGFTTDYTLYRNTTTGQYVTVFGDRDLYRPEDGWFDAEFDSEDEAYEWFESYNTDEWAE